MALSVDSAAPLLKEVLGTLQRLEEILSYVGIFYIGKLTLPTVFDILKGFRTHVWSKLRAKRLVEKYGKWAVVTGSTDGIGKAYAYELARNGMNIVLIAESLEQMENVAADIRQEFGVETEIIIADFTSGRAAYNDISKSISQKDIGLLVNGAGVLASHSFLLENIPEDDVWNFVNASVGATPAMTRVILPGMIKQKRGAIINVSPLGAYIPNPYKQLCTASKAFLDSYSQALEYECRSSGVIVQTLIPGLLAPDSSKLQNGKDFWLNILKPSASTYVVHALSTLGYSRRTTGFLLHGVLAWLFERIPETLLVWSYALAYKVSLDRKKLE